MNEYYSTLSGWLIPITKAMNDANLQTSTILDQFDIDPACINNPEARIGIERLSDLLIHCNKQALGFYFPTQVAKNFHPSTFHALGYAMISSDSLLDAFERIAQYKRVISNCCSMQVHTDDNKMVSELIVHKYPDSGRNVLSRISTETFMATLVQFSREIASYEPDVKLVTFAYERPDNTQYLEEYFGCEVEFGAEKNTIVYDLEEAKKRALGCNPMINQVHKKVLDQFLSRVDKENLTYTIINSITDHLSLGAPSQSDIAKQLGISLRNLQRKLNEQGTSYKEILENTRKRIAMEYIKQPHLSLGEIGYLVGFSSVANFNRAFKRWTNCTPGEYRARYLSSSDIESSNDTENSRDVESSSDIKSDISQSHASLQG